MRGSRLGGEDREVERLWESVGRDHEAVRKGRIVSEGGDVSLFVSLKNNKKKQNSIQVSSLYINKQ